MPELDRRDFLKLVGAGAGAAAAAGCADPVEKLVPYVIQPEEITPGIAVRYASTCQECPVACGLHVTTREGRPIKLEGHPEHPINRGGLCARGQAAIQRTYHPDRYEGPLARTDGELQATTWEQGLETLVAAIRTAGASGLRVLGGGRGPTLDGLIDGWIAAIGGDPASQRLVYQPFAELALRRGTASVFGVERTPLFDLSQADLILDFGSDFLDTGLSPVEHARHFGEARDPRSRPDGGARLVSITPRMDLTVSSADQWIPAAPGSEGLLALALAKAVHDHLVGQGRQIAGDGAAVAKLLGGVDREVAASLAGVDAVTLDGLVERVLAARAPVALPPGVAAASGQAASAAAAVMLLNALVGAVGGSVRIPDLDAGPAPAGMGKIARLIDDMNAGRVGVLLIHDANPLYSLPADSGFASALDKVDLVVSTAPLRDETSEAADLVLPDHAPLESWGDARPRAGARSLVQPTIRPLFDTQSLGDALLAVGRALGDEVAAKLPTGSFRAVLEAAWSDTDWRRALASGGVFGDPAPSLPGEIASTVGGIELGEPQLEGEGDYALLAYPQSFLGDGRGAALPWLQETPDPVTKASWVSWAEVSKQTAESLGVEFGEVLSIETDFGAGRIEVPVYPRGGIRDDVVAVAIGQGHTVGHYASMEGDGQPGAARGASVISLLPARSDEGGGRAWLSARARLAKTGGFRRIPISQWTDNQRERGLAPVVSLLALAEGAEAHDGDHGESHFRHTELGLVSPYDRQNDSHPDSPYRWGLTIDNDRCIGCSACVVACSIENNVPTVGERGALRHRDMTWIRVERYNGDGDRRGGASRRPHPDREELGEVDVRHAPMLCQQCGAAPCESVCPVIATYHTPEGLNGMVYNRCVGTRYCANNCVYKVRRFNYFDYSRENWPGLLHLGLNPDVTVRTQGVMEKCTFCVQRISAARQAAKDQGRPIRDGEVVTACQQTCPTQAITFGNTRDPASQVVTNADQPARTYRSLEVLNARPAITYLAQVVREADERSQG
jgi:molybdopterin-containing oxidoreductase family iron-sulfur binding subunit